jgi:anti-sigma B factor antagonist
MIVAEVEAMNIWILRYPEPRTRPGAPWELVVIQRDSEGEESQIDLIQIEGRSPTLQEIVQTQLDRGRNYLVLDLDHVKHLDSSDLAQVLGAFKLATEAEGHVVIANPNARIREILRITRLEDVLPLFDSIETAAQHFDSSG